MVDDAIDPQNKLSGTTPMMFSTKKWWMSCVEEEGEGEWGGIEIPWEIRLPNSYKAIDKDERNDSV